MRYLHPPGRSVATGGFQEEGCPPCSAPALCSSAAWLPLSYTSLLPCPQGSTFFFSFCRSLFCLELLSLPISLSPPLPSILKKNSGEKRLGKMLIHIESGPAQATGASRTHLEPEVIQHYREKQLNSAFACFCMWATTRNLPVCNR